MIINHNITALNTHGKLSSASAAQSKSMEKLASGLRINRAGDDAAGLAISEKMRAQVRGLDQASRNAQDGISLIQTAEGALNETHDILQRVRELADQSANGTNTNDDRKAIQDEVKQLKEEIDRIGNTTEFNTQKLLNGSLKSALGSIVGSNSTTSSVVGKLESGKMTAAQALAADLSSTTFGKDTFDIDGHKVDVNWDTLLSQTEKDQIKATTATSGIAQLNSVKDLLTNKLNEAIDQYNSSNPAGATVQHIEGYLDSATAASAKLVLKSGSQGTDSAVQLVTSSGATGVGALIASNTAGDVSDPASTVNYGTNKYNGSTVASGATFEMDLNGVKMKVTTGAAINNTTTMDAAATTIQTAIKTAVDSYNTLQGKSAGQEGFVEAIKVTASKDGRFQVSSESGTVNFKDYEGKSDVLNLGLSQAQTESAGGGGMSFQIGANKGQSISVGLNDMRTAALGLSGVDVSTKEGASSSLDSLDKAIKNVSSERSKLGAVQNRLEHTINNLKTSSENLTAAESRVRDVDMAKEMMNQTKNSILAQAAQAMLAQSNQTPQGVLQLLR
ncbi:flagellin [uncultured Exiguobacterium sp.]|uniref:flagellin N-terminal helical domain-containing protein n=1 Tax=uncultured Exiguobacterium sp. TaxID=202669 RepID=UPI00374937D6